jgi:hypothetical protein
MPNALKAPAQCPRCEAQFRVAVPGAGVYQTHCPDCEHWLTFRAEEPAR